jgi:hypothetical protein
MEVFSIRTYLHKLIIPFFTLLLLSGSLVAAFVLTAATPGSVNDPLISESYLRQQLGIEQAARFVLAERVTQLEFDLSQIRQAMQNGADPVFPPNLSSFPPNDELDQLAARLASLEEQLAAMQQIDVSTATLPPRMQIITLRAGEAVYASEGSEIILRAGELAVITEGVGGISDLTAGVDLLDGALIQTNHLMLVPRDDGRGVIALTDAIFLLRGEIRFR